MFCLLSKKSKTPTLSGPLSLFQCHCRLINESNRSIGGGWLKVAGKIFKDKEKVLQKVVEGDIRCSKFEWGCQKPHRCSLTWRNQAIFQFYLGFKKYYVILKSRCVEENWNAMQKNYFFLKSSLLLVGNQVVFWGASWFPGYFLSLCIIFKTTPEFVVLRGKHVCV